MLGSRTGIRDITKGVNDSRQAIRGMKIDLAKDPARKLELLIQERDAKIKEADAARDKAYGWGAKKFIQVADRADHHARKAEAQIQSLMTRYPDLEPTRKVTASERIEDERFATAAIDRRYKAGEITKLERAQELQQRMYNLRTKQDGAAIPEKSHRVALILSVLLGFVGADRFYLNHDGVGLAKIASLLLMVGVVWWLVDILLIATKGTARLQVVNWKPRKGAIEAAPEPVVATP